MPKLHTSDLWENFSSEIDSGAYLNQTGHKTTNKLKQNNNAFVNTESFRDQKKQHFIKSVITRVLITFILSQLTGNFLRTLANSGKFLSKFVQHYLIFNNVLKMLAQNVSGYVCNHSSLRMGTRHCVLFRGSLWERLQRDRLPEA